jgi:galactokinase
MIADLQARARAARLFRRWTSRPPLRLGVAPGRINLIGEHTDYNGGRVLPLAIERYVAVAAAPGGPGRLRILAGDLGGREFAIPLRGLATLQGNQRAPAWARLLAGVADQLVAEGVPVGGADLAIAGDVPRGAGLSSSAALGVAGALALADLAEVSLPPLTLARLVQRAEHAYLGTRCGIMDPLASAGGEDGRALLIDCYEETYETISLPASWSFLVIDSGVSRALAESGYNDRRAECEEIARTLGLASLRDLGSHHLRLIRERMPEGPYRRTYHVFGENARVEAAVRSLRTDDLRFFGALLNSSHASLHRDYEVTVPETHELAQTLQDFIGSQGGARMMGGGFGGAVLGVTCRERAAEVLESTLKLYRRRHPQLEAAGWIMRPSRGAWSEAPPPELSRSRRWWSAGASRGGRPSAASGALASE